MISGRRSEDEVGSVRRPVQVTDRSAALDVIATRRTVLVGLHVQTHDVVARRPVEVEHDPGDPKDHRVLG